MKILSKRFIIFLSLMGICFINWAISDREIKRKIKLYYHYNYCIIEPKGKSLIKIIMAYNKSTISFGETWDLLLLVYAKTDDYQYELPFIEDKIISKFFLILAQPILFKKDNLSLTGYQLTLKPIDSGVITFKNLYLNYWDKDLPSQINKIPLPEIKITVKPILPAKELKKLQKEKEPSLNLIYLHNWLLIVILIFILILVFLTLVIVFMKKKKEKIIKEQQKDPFTEAYDRLRKLREWELKEPEEIKSFYYELSNVLRHFIELVYDINAPELTTEEFLEKLKYTNTLDKTHKKILREFLKESDMVKYAKHVPSEEQIAKSFTTVIDFIKATEKIIRQQQKSELKENEI